SAADSDSANASKIAASSSSSETSRVASVLTGGAQNAKNGQRPHWSGSLTPSGGILAETAVLTLSARCKISSMYSQSTGNSIAFISKRLLLFTAIITQFSRLNAIA